MIRTIRGVTAIAGVSALAACQSLPNVPTSIFSGASGDCPAYETGPSDFSPPFPTECRTLNKTASGVRYIPVTNGDQAGGSPKMDATIVVHYQAYLAGDGTQIDNSYARGESSVYQMADLIDGWAEAVQLMNPGDEWMVFVPSAEAFGDLAVGDLIPPNSDLVYRVKLEGFLSADQLQIAAETQTAELEQAEPDAPNPETSTIAEPLGPDMAAWQAYFPWDASKDEVTTLPSGVSVVMLEQGDSEGATAQASDSVLIHYEGRLAESSEFFDSSWSRGEPTRFNVGALIPGFTEGLMQMRPGDRILVHIPSEQAYGADGAGEAVPANADLMFQIVLLQIDPAG